ncbi:MAG: hypothetical protein NT141_04510 [candidate division WWE3 bacterium]|nr:hypothetical protein [candidate division WWE3 bacterium]
MESILVNPYTAIRLFAKTYLAYGDTVLIDRRYKVTREAWIASMFLIALKKQTGNDWWLTPVLNSGSPDFECYSFYIESDYKFVVRSVIKLEVFEWRKASNGDDFVGSIKRIKLDKIIDPEITLLCYIRRNCTVQPAVELSKQMAELNPRVKDIWYLGDVSGDSTNWRVAKVYPDNLAADINYDDVLRTTEQYSFLGPHRGKSNKVEFEPTGKKILLTPEFKIVELPN